MIKKLDLEIKSPYGYLVFFSKNGITPGKINFQ